MPDTLSHPPPPITPSLGLKIDTLLSFSMPLAPPPAPRASATAACSSRSGCCSA
jgi:hypothetical protein